MRLGYLLSVGAVSAAIAAAVSIPGAAGVAVAAGSAAALAVCRGTNFTSFTSFRSVHNSSDIPGHCNFTVPDCELDQQSFSEFRAAATNKTLAQKMTKADVGATTGEKGPQGEQGNQGSRGQRGPQGEQGEKGVRGQKGPKGPPGQNGYYSPRGDGGKKGPPGTEKGPTGEPGPKGDKGPDAVATRAIPAYVVTGFGSFFAAFHTALISSALAVVFLVRFQQERHPQPDDGPEDEPLYNARGEVMSDEQVIKAVRLTKTQEGYLLKQSKDKFSTQAKGAKDQFIMEQEVILNAKKEETRTRQEEKSLLEQKKRLELEEKRIALAEERQKAETRKREQRQKLLEQQQLEMQNENHQKQKLLEEKQKLLEQKEQQVEFERQRVALEEEKALLAKKALLYQQTQLLLQTTDEIDGSDGTTSSTPATSNTSTGRPVGGSNPATSGKKGEGKLVGKSALNSSAPTEGAANTVKNGTNSPPRRGRRPSFRKPATETAL